MTVNNRKTGIKVMKIASKNWAGWVIRERNERKLCGGAMDRVMIVEEEKEGGRDRRRYSLLAGLHSYSLQCTSTPRSA